tara:strand:- start:4261 stop:4785 length:525 start_codon:yes stop_codon:yes gene_type:complete
MDVLFGDVVTVDGDAQLAVSTGNGKQVFKQINNVRVESIEETDGTRLVTFNLQENDISSYDEDIMAAAKTHKKEWFGREVKDSVIDKAYHSPVDNGIFTTTQHTGMTCWNHQKEIVDNSDLTEGMVCSVVVELKRILFYKKSFEPEWLSVQVKIPEPPAPDPYSGYLFQDDDNQ